MIDLCFWDKACIRKRNEAQAAAQAAVQEQQQILMQITNQPAGGLNAWAITGIIVAVLGIAAFVIYKIKRKKSN